MPDVQTNKEQPLLLLTMHGFAQRFWTAIFPVPVTLREDGPPRSWRLLAAAPLGLASSVAQALGLIADVVSGGESLAASRHGVSRAVAAGFLEARIEQGGYSGAFLAPPPDADLCAWMARARRSVGERAPIAMLTTVAALEGADHWNLVYGLDALNLYRLPPVAAQRDAPLPDDQVLVTGVATERAAPPDQARTLLQAALQDRRTLPAFGRRTEPWEQGHGPEDYPFNRVRRHGTAQSPLRLAGLARPASERPLFAGPAPAGARAMRLGAERGIFASNARRAALATPSEQRIATLEEARESHLAQLCAVSPSAQRVEHDGANLLVRFYTARQITREGALERGADDEVIGAEIVESESLETVAAALDLDSGALRKIDAEELKRLQIELAPQLLESLEAKLDPAITPDRAVPAWNELAGNRPAALAERELGREPWGRQAQTAVAGALALERNGSWILVGQQGVGKTSVLATTGWLGGHRRIAVVCPPQVIPEWEQQIREVLPGARMLIVRRPAELAAVPEPPADAQQVIFFPDSVLGMERREPQALARKRLVALADLVDRNRVRYHGARANGRLELDLGCPSCGAAQEHQGRERPVDHGAYMRNAQQRRGWRSCQQCEEPLWQYVSEGQRKRTPVCNACGWHQLSRDGQPLSERAVRHGACSACGAQRTAPDAIGWKLVDYRPWSLSAAWKRQRFETDLLVFDEAHRFKAGDSLRGIEAGRLMQLAPRVAIATATLTDGRASSLYYLLLRLTPELRNKFPTETSFTRRFGVRQVRYRVRYNADEQLQRRNQRVNELAGLHPAVLGELLHCASFIEQSDVLANPVHLTEYLEVVRLPAQPSRLIDAQQDPAAWREWMDGPFAAGLALAAERGTEARRLEWELVQRLAEGEISWDDLSRGMAERLGGVFARSPSARSRYREIVVGLPDDAWGRRTGTAQQVARHLPDTWHWRGEIVIGQEGTPYLALPPAADGSSPKEQRLVEICQGEAAAGRRCLVLVDAMQVRDLAGRLGEVLGAAGLRAVVLRPNSGGGPAGRKAWIDRQLVRGLDVMVAHPGSVGIGLNLQPFVTMICFQVNASNYLLRQAMMRSLRVDQREEVKHVYMTTLNTRQETELIMQMSRSLAAIPIEGRVLGPERLARQLGVVAMAAQDRALALMDEQRGNELPEATARALTEARELIPGVAMRRRYEAPEPLAIAQPQRQAVPLPPPWLAANDLEALAATATSEARGGQMALFGSEFGTQELAAVAPAVIEPVSAEHVSGELAELRRAA